MPVIAGIDEAGYGPTLGPLVLTATALRAASYDECNLWTALSDSIAGEVKGASGRLVVGDSKKLYSGNHRKTGRGLRLLEEVVLSFSRVVKSPAEARFPRAFGGLLKELGFGADDYAANYPWYAASDIQLPLASDENDIVKKSERLRDNLKAAGIEFRGAYCLPTPVADFNRGVKAAGNKARFLFNESAKLLRSLWEQFACEGDSLRVFVDKQGGRDKYAPLLCDAFGRADLFDLSACGHAQAGASNKKCKLKILQEGRECSSYRIQIEGKRMVVSFVKGADALYMSVGLASIFSKYIRELHLKLFNDFWLERLPNIGPTAGYPQDAKRFLAEIEDTRRELGIDYDILVRVK